jgi:nitroreductase
MEHDMDLLEALKNRKVCRAFTDEPVAPELVREIVQISTNASSGSNLQPWEVYGVCGSKKEELCQRIVASFHAGGGPRPPSYSGKVPEKYTARTTRLFRDLKPYLSRLGVSNNHIVEGSLRYFNAPVALFIFIHESLTPVRLPCIGSFMAHLMLAAQAFGLASCPIGYVRAVEDEIKDFLGIAPDLKFVISIGIGHPDPGNPINEFKAARIPLADNYHFVA